MIELKITIRDNIGSEGLAIGMTFDSNNPSEQELSYAHFINDGIQTLLGYAIPDGKMFSDVTLGENNEIIPNIGEKQ